VEQDEDDEHGREGRLRIAQLTALLHEFELHLRKNAVERARDRLATITTTLALALTGCTEARDEVGGIDPLPTWGKKGAVL
jgi:hypothetical protein